MKTPLLKTNPNSELIISSFLPFVSDQGPANRAKITEGMAYRIYIIVMLFIFH